MPSPKNTPPALDRAVLSAALRFYGRFGQGADLSPKDILRFLDAHRTVRTATLRSQVGAEFVDDILRNGYTSSLPAGAPPQGGQVWAAGRGLSYHQAATLSELRVDALWSHAGSTVYVMNPELVEALTEAHTDILEMPIAAISALPHPSPLILLPRPVEIIMGNGQTGHVVAIYVGGLAHDERTPEGAGGTGVTTDDPTCNGISIMLYCQIDEETTDVATIQIVAPGASSIRYAVERSVDRFHIGAPTNLDAEQRRAVITAHVMAAAMLAVSCLAYACSANSDLDVLPRAPKGRKVPGNPTGKGTPPAWINVGYVVGPAIGAARREVTERVTGGDGTRSVRPHIRRLHLHLYWTGPGRTIPVIRTLLPIAVRGGKSTKPTVHHVN